MAKFKLLSLSTPVAGREDAFHDWYQNIHLPELVAFAGVQGAQRYQLVTRLAGADTNPWLAIYDIECDDPRSFLAALGEASASGALTPTDTSDMSTNFTALFTEHGARVEAA